MGTESTSGDRGRGTAGTNDGAHSVQRTGVTDEGSRPTTRGQQLYDRWSSHDGLYDAVMKLAAPLREDTFAQLALEPGETVLDLGCGHGINFPRLRDDVGPEGRVVGLDYSPGMTERATDRVTAEGWTNVDVVRGDATRTVVEPAAFDAAVTTFALHTMENVDAVVENVHAMLRPGGRFVVLDSRGLQTWPARLLNPLFERALARLVNHQPEEDPLAALRETFETVDVVETYDAGSGYLAVGRKSPAEDDTGS